MGKTRKRSEGLYIKMDPSEDLAQAHSMGTSIMAVEFDGGVVIGADSRTTTGSYVANRTSDKLTPVHDRIYCCRSGSAADTQAIAGYVRYYLEMHGIEIGELPQVATAASLFRKLCYENKNNLMAGIICGGWDPVKGGQVYSITIGGSLVKLPFALGGSGSIYIYGWVDDNYKEGMTREECLDFVRNALSLAMARDGSSGGVIRTVVLDKDGATRAMVPGNALPRHFEGQAELHHV